MTELERAVLNFYRQLDDRMKAEFRALIMSISDENEEAEIVSKSDTRTIVPGRGAGT